MSERATHTVRDYSRASGTHLLVLYALATYMDDGTHCGWPSADTLARGAGVSRRTVLRVLADLVADGELVREARGGRGKGSTYRLVDLKALYGGSRQGLPVAPPDGQLPLVKGVTQAAHNPAGKGDIQVAHKAAVAATESVPSAAESVPSGPESVPPTRARGGKGRTTEELQLASSTRKGGGRVELTNTPDAVATAACDRCGAPQRQPCHDTDGTPYVRPDGAPRAHLERHIAAVAAGAPINGEQQLRASARAHQPPPPLTLDPPDPAVSARWRLQALPKALEHTGDRGAMWVGAVTVIGMDGPLAVLAAPPQQHAWCCDRFGRLLVRCALLDGIPARMATPAEAEAAAADPLRATG